MADKIYTIKGSTLTGLGDTVRAFNKTSDLMTLATIKEELDKIPAKIEAAYQDGQANGGVGGFTQEDLEGSYNNGYDQAKNEWQNWLDSSSIQSQGISTYFSESDAKCEWNLYSSDDITVDNIENFVSISEIAEYCGMFSFEDLENKPYRIMSGNSGGGSFWTGGNIECNGGAVYIPVGELYEVDSSGLTLRDVAQVSTDEIISALESAGYTVTENDEK